MLWVMVVLSAVALPLAFSSHLRVQITASIGHGTQALYLARAGVERAIADLNSGRDSLQTLGDLRESEGTSFQNIEIGPGTYTLFAGYDPNGDPSYGITDEGAKINVCTAGTTILAKLPGVSNTLAAALVAQRNRMPINDLNDLLLLEQMSLQQLFGEDANGNGILDANENDGSESWPEDNADGRLDRGLSAHLTTCSAARNVTNAGEKRVNINSASAEDITKSVSGISLEQAQSIVEHRKKNQFASIVELLDVKMVKKVAKKPDNKKPDDKKPDRNESANKKPSEVGNKNNASEDKGNANFETTNQNAFDQNTFRRMADAVTITDDNVRKGVVNLNTASEDVMACIPGITRELAANIRQVREKRADGFQSIADLLDVEGVSTATLKQFCPHVSVRSDVFSVWSYGVIQSGSMFRCVHAIIDRTEEATRIRHWRELG